MENYFFKKFNFGILFIQINNLNKQGSLGCNINYDYTPIPKDRELKDYNGNFNLYILLGLIKYQISFGVDIILKSKGE